MIYELGLDLFYKSGQYVTRVHPMEIVDIIYRIKSSPDEEYILQNVKGQIISLQNHSMKVLNERVLQNILYKNIVSIQKVEQE